MPRSLLPRTMRARLTLWNTLVVALILLALAGALRVILTKSILDSIDTDIEGRARHTQKVTDALIDLILKNANATGKKAPTPSPSPQPIPSANSSLESPSPGKVGAPDQWQTRLVEKVFDSKGKRIFSPQDDPPLNQGALRRSSRGEELFLTVRIEGQNVRIFSAPLSRRDPSQPFPVVQIGYFLQDFERGQKNLDRTLIILVPFGLLAAGAGGLFLTSQMLRPVREATQKAAQIGASDLSERLPVEGGDEFA